MDIISKKTRNEFLEFLTSKTLREITIYFDNHDIFLSEKSQGIIDWWQRRTLITQYYASIDWWNAYQIKKLIGVYEEILNDLEEPNLWDSDYNALNLTRLSKFLLRDGYIFKNHKLEKTSSIENFEALENATSLLDKTHFHEYLERIKKSVDTDPGLAIGSTKELIESTLKTILTQSKIDFEKNDDIPKLLKTVQKTLELIPDWVDDAKIGAEIIKILLNNLGSVVIKLAELRNLYGTGHWKEKRRSGLSGRHARLAVWAGITLSTFLLETFEYRRTL